jgi:hypothetical protein
METLKGGDKLKVMDVDGRIILEWMWRRVRVPSP